MRVAIVGGTGKLGSALAVALSRNNDVTIGSRNREKAELTAGRLSASSGRRILGTTNRDACSTSEIVIISIPYTGMESVISDLADVLRGKTVISSVVPVEKRDGYFIYISGTSAAEEIASRLRGASVCSAFHTVPYTLIKRTKNISIDVPVASDSPDSYKTASMLICSLDGMRPIYSGPLFTSRYIESITVLLLNISKLNSLKNPFIRIVSADER